MKKIFYSDTYTEKIINLITNAAETIKAIDCETFNVSSKSSIVDYFIICSGRTHIQINAITRTICKALKQHKIPYQLDGTRNSKWIAIDTGPIIVHIMGIEERTKYNLEEIWKDSAIIYH